MDRCQEQFKLACLLFGYKAQTTTPSLGPRCSEQARLAARDQVRITFEPRTERSNIRALKAHVTLAEATTDPTCQPDLYLSSCRSVAALSVQGVPTFEKYGNIGMGYGLTRIDYMTWDLGDVLQDSLNVRLRRVERLKPDQPCPTAHSLSPRTPWAFPSSAE